MGANTLDAERAAKLAAFETLRKIIAITTEIFGEDVHVKNSCDPEFTEERYVVFSVSTRRDPQGVVAQESEWVRRVGEVSPDWHAFRLSIRPAA